MPKDLIIFAASAVFCVAVLTDLRERRISNKLVLTVILLAAVRMIADLDPRAALATVEGAGLVLVGSLVFWRLRWLGGGDAKLIFAGSLLVGSAAVPDFLVLTGLVGGVLGLFVLADLSLYRNYGLSAGLAFPLTRVSPGDGRAPAPRKPSVPYGVAVSIGCILTLFFTSAPVGR